MPRSSRQLAVIAVLCRRKGRPRFDVSGREGFEGASHFGGILARLVSPRVVSPEAGVDSKAESDAVDCSAASARRLVSLVSQEVQH